MEFPLAQDIEPKFGSKLLAWTYTWASHMGLNLGIVFGYYTITTEKERL